MLIDWLTLKICSSLLSPETLSLLRADASTIMCISPDGSIEWESISRVNVRSDSHQLQVAVGGFVIISGSPARFFPDESGINDNVFGDLDIVSNANLMLEHVSNSVGSELPIFSDWQLTRIDITDNYYLSGGSHDCEQVLSHWKGVDFGKYKTTTFGNSVYFQKGNRINSGKAYHKAPQMLKDFRKRFPDVMKHIKEDYCFDDVLCQLALDKVCNDTSLNDFEILEKTKIIHDIWYKADVISKRLQQAKSILRLEATFGSRYWNEKNKKTGLYLYRLKPWFKYTAIDLKKMFDDYFDTRLGKGVDVKDISNLKSKFISAAVDAGYSEKIGVSAYKTFGIVKQLGKFAVWSKNNPDSLMAKATFYRDRKIALLAGLTLADFETGVVLPFQRRTIEMKSVSSWDELKKLAS